MPVAAFQLNSERNTYFAAAATDTTYQLTAALRESQQAQLLIAIRS